MMKLLFDFSPEIMPYLINLKKNFTQHALSDISELNSKHSIILYRWLSMNYNQYEHYSVIRVDGEKNKWKPTAILQFQSENYEK